MPQKNSSTASVTTEPRAFVIGTGTENRANNSSFEEGSQQAQKEVVVAPASRPQPEKEEEDDIEASMARKMKQHKKWNRRLKIFFCCLGYKKHKVGS